MEKECEAERVAGHRIFKAREFRTCRAHLIRVICRGFSVVLTPTRLAKDIQTRACFSTA